MKESGVCSNERCAAGLNTNGTEVTLADQLPPWQVACGTRGQASSESASSTAHSSTAGTWHWRRRTVQTCLHSVHPGTHHTAGHQAHTASPPPAPTHTHTRPSSAPVYLLRPNNIPVLLVAAGEKVEMGGGANKFLFKFYVTTCRAILHNNP